MEVQELIDILTAFKAGKKIESYIALNEQNSDGTLSYFTHKWVIQTTLKGICGAIAAGVEVRVKPEPKYRPYKNADEFVKASIKHKDLMRSKTVDDHPLKTKYLRPCNITDEDVWGVNCGNAMFDYRMLLNMFVWNDDGSPCGVLEEE